MRAHMGDDVSSTRTALAEDAEDDADFGDGIEGVWIAPDGYEAVTYADAAEDVDAW